MCPSLPLSDEGLALGVLQDVVPLGVDREVDRDIAGLPFLPTEELVPLAEESPLEQLLCGLVRVQIQQRHAYCLQRQ